MRLGFVMNSKLACGRCMGVRNISLTVRTYMHKITSVTIRIIVRMTIITITIVVIAKLRRIARTRRKK